MHTGDSQGKCSPGKGCKTDACNTPEGSKGDRKHQVSCHLCYIGGKAYALIAVSQHHLCHKHIQRREQDSTAVPEKIGLCQQEYSLFRLIKEQVAVSKSQEQGKQNAACHYCGSKTQRKPVSSRFLVKFAHGLGI